MTTNPLRETGLQPSPDAAPAGALRRGRLRIFFGYARGVGKTRAMLQAAQEAAAQGTRVLLAGGAVEPAAVPAGVEVLGTAPGGTFDLDTLLRRRPELLLLPGLAGRNPSGARHRRRHQDVEELREAGIDVWSTLEVQHLESLADLVQKITRSPVPDTIPDAVFDAADEVELIDLPPEELLEHARRNTPAPVPGEGEQPVAARATLVALRELALRRAADRLNSQEQIRRNGARSPAPEWRTAERLLVCVGPSPTSDRVIRTASRMARSMQAAWTAVYAGRLDAMAEEDERRVSRHLRLAESLGARTRVLPGGSIPREIVDFARAHAVTKILIGKTGRPAWRSLLRRSLVDQVIAASGDVDVYVIRGTESSRGREEGAAAPARRLRLPAYAGAAVLLGAATALGAAFEALGLTEANVVLAYLLGVTAAAVWLGRGPAILASIGAVVLFNFFFTSPRFTFAVHDTGSLFTFAVMLGIGVLVSTLTARIRDHSVAAGQRERRTEQLYQLSQELSAATGHLQIASAAGARLSALLESPVSILLPDERGRLRSAAPAFPELARDLPVAHWVFEHGRIAGAGTETHAGASVVCLPLTTPDGVAGVLAIRAQDPGVLLLPERRRLVETFAAQVALALQRDRLTEEMHRTLAQAETERLRNALLSSVSHDLRTPLAAITGASSSLLDAGERIAPEEQRALLFSIYEEGHRLGRLVDNLLHLTRLESGRFELRREWHFLEDLVGSALTRLRRQLGARGITTCIPGDVPMLCVDGVLIELVLLNLLDNADKYSPPGAPIDLAARVEDGSVLVEVADRGPGLPDSEKARVFEKFYRGSASRGSGGAGLGLAICAAVVRLHGGSLRVLDRDGGGARFVVGLPLEDPPPALELHDASDARGGPS